MSLPIPTEILEVCERQDVPSPCYLIHRGLLESNLRVLEAVQEQSGAAIILALKGFASHCVFPQVRRVLRGTTASSIHEARLGLEEFGGELHAYCVAYSAEELTWLAKVARHVTLNSATQLQAFRSIVVEGAASFGLRINPEYSEVSTAIYDPCRPGTRFGITQTQLSGLDLTGIEGLHFHTMCEQNSDTLVRTLEHVERKFGDVLRQMKWLNMGGGHHITRHDYDVDLLCRTVQRIRDEYGVAVYLEPGEAVALNTGFLVATVLDRFRSSDTEVAILDTSATAHMPDVLEMPYRPEIIGAGDAGEKKYTVRLGGLTCLAGDVIGDYSFDAPVSIGQRIVFTDMAHYTMVKNTTFNGVQLPAIATYDPESETVNIAREFGYADYRDRLS